jgi:hypothetical protein
MRALSGYGISEASPLDLVNPVLSIVYPAAGDTLYSGLYHEISWTCIDSNLSSESTSLWYSIDGGSSYFSMAQNIPATAPFQWLVPETETVNAKIQLKVTDTFGNSKRAFTQFPFSIIDAPLSTPTGISISVDNVTNDINIYWQPVNSLVTGYPLSADAYIVLCSDTPAEDIESYTVLSMLKALTYTHLAAADQYGKNFYRIIAFAATGNVRTAIQTKLDQTPETPLTWGEMKAYIDLIKRGNQ